MRARENEVFFKFPECELLPLDETNYVSVLFEIKPQMPFRLSVPYPYMIDPTRKLENCRLLYVCPREELVMYHYSFVRKSIESKLMNVSNRNNYIKPPRLYTEIPLLDTF